MRSSYTYRKPATAVTHGWYVARGIFYILIALAVISLPVLPTAAIWGWDAAGAGLIFWPAIGVVWFAVWILWGIGGGWDD